MYLDGGLDVVRPFVKQSVLAQELEARFSDAHLLSTTDYKSALQEAAHASGRVQPSYVLVQEEGPPHQKLFTVEVRLHRGTRRGRAEYVARAKGPSKKTAEQNAARDALSYLQTHNAPAESTSNGPRRRIIKGGHDE
jgi:ribonuclease-3